MQLGLRGKRRLRVMFLLGRCTPTAPRVCGSVKASIFPLIPALVWRRLWPTSHSSDLQGGASLAIQASLGEFWALFQKMMLPGWNGNGPICWRCKTTPADMLEDVEVTTKRVGGGRLSFFHASTSNLGEPSYQEGA